MSSLEHFQLEASSRLILDFPDVSQQTNPMRKLLPIAGLFLLGASAVNGVFVHDRAIARQRQETRLDGEVKAAREKALNKTRVEGRLRKMVEVDIRQERERNAFNERLGLKDQGISTLDFRRRWKDEYWKMKARHEKEWNAVNAMP